MSSFTISLVVFAFIFGGALLGMALRASLPEHNLSAESKEVVKLGMGLVGTMAALVLGLLVASAKNSFDAQSSELTRRFIANNAPDPLGVLCGFIASAGIRRGSPNFAAAHG